MMSNTVSRSNSSFFFGIMCLLIGVSGVPKEVVAQPWLEYWQQFSYRSSNLSEEAPNKAQDFFLLVTTARLGYRFAISDGSQDSGWRSGFDVYGRFENVHDFAFREPFHDNVYNNQNRVAAGVKMRFEKEWVSTAGRSVKSLFRYLQADLYAETQYMNTSVDRVRYWFDNITQTNTRIGLNIWGNSDYATPGLPQNVRHETYFDLSYHRTNFADKGHEGFFVLTFSPRFFYRLPYSKSAIFDIYLNGEVIYDFLDKGTWNNNPFSNNVKAFGGVRSILTAEHLKLDDNKLFKHASILFFTEVGVVDYFPALEEYPFYGGNDALRLSTLDLRAGIILWLPLGEARYRPIGQSRI